MSGAAQRVRPRLGRVAATGVVATVVAAAATTAGAALAKAAGVDFEVPDGGESIPVAGFTTITSVFSLVGVAIATVLARWSADPAKRFVMVSVPLAVASLVPPVVVGASTSTAITLVALHVLAALVMIPALSSALTVKS